MIDGIGKEWNDELSSFLEWYLEAGNKIFVPAENSVHFVEGVTGMTIYRHGPFQVQLFTITPDTIVPEHMHPNVDSFEVALAGIEFYLNGETALSMDYSLDIHKESKLSMAFYKVLRVLPETPHGGLSSSNGGCFMSVQHWLNGVEPTSVGNDWKGIETMGNKHDSQVITSEEKINE